MNAQRFLLSIFVCALFFILATSTSKDDIYPLVSIELNAEVILLDSSLVLTNNDTLPVESANLYLTYIVDTTAENVELKYFVLSDYELEINGVDTLLFSEFIGQNPYPTDTIPNSFYLYFLNSHMTEASFLKEF